MRNPRVFSRYSSSHGSISHFDDKSSLKSRMKADFDDDLVKSTNPTAKKNQLRMEEVKGLELNLKFRLRGRKSEKRGKFK
ncbi:hypothetical protein OSB04_010077 [Centaurea solstitialis]|uniref:Uncharacterized protein n=1 Tax=Centaurea solstitialis TaxID=347529 RepID=A0AA38T6U4_9ASTR|nr:hypothetical protein OSB04_010077 [Centaurea solstitialis]